ncbi:MAG TPA: DUF5652 family protein [Candidatus Nanoarchaeia archaeon]|nr:DUF5652 family protein [Candidatus Nanoarchaeia archaeon]
MVFPSYDLSNPSTLIWILPLIVWELIWKAVAMWKAGRNNQLSWFIAILIINSIGILPIIYILFFRKKEKKTNKPETISSRKKAKKR